MSNHLCFHPFQPILLFLTCDNVKTVIRQMYGSEKPDLFRAAILRAGHEVQERVNSVMLNGGHAGIECSEEHHTSFAGDL